MLITPRTVQAMVADPATPNSYVTIDGWLHVSGDLLLISDHEQPAPPLVSVDGDAVLKIVQRLRGRTRFSGMTELSYHAPVRIAGAVMDTGIAAVPYRFSHVHRVVLVDPAGQTSMHTINEPVYDVYVTLPAALTDAHKQVLLELLSGNVLDERLRLRSGNRVCLLRAQNTEKASAAHRTLEAAGLKVEVEPTPYVRGKPLTGDGAAFLQII